MDSMRIELLKNKDEGAQSAIASQEVRKHLAGFIRSKRLGSSTQISCIASQSQQKALSQSPGCSAASFQPGTDANNLAAYDNCAAGPIVCQSSRGNESDDHPLRKTASMPTMHIPYKAQTLSRRRQMERRTTMSPLMKRKSRPRRLLLHSLDSQAAEYSSNPCIMAHASGSNFPISLSQSSSPPSMAIGTSNQTHPSHFDNHKNVDLLSDSMMRASSHSNLNKNHLKAMKSIELMGAGEEGRQKQLQHLRVQEAIRKTVINRASSRSKMAAAGGSLDSEMPSTKLASSSFMVAGLDGTSTEAHAPSGQTISSRSHLLLSAQNRDELRQWSLDGADLSFNLNANLAASSRTLAWGLYHRLRLGTTVDAATLRQSQSPSSSISMGVTSKANMQQQQQKSTNMIDQQLLQAFGERDPVSRLNQQLQQQQQLMHASRLYSSSSSSTSSLLSAQDSLDDPLSKAIDLSSSSEAVRRRQQQQQALNSSSVIFDRPPIMAPSSDQTNRLNYQKVLQDSFNQMQLSQENMKRILLPAHSNEVGQPTSQHLQHPSSQHPHPFLGQINKTAISLDTSIHNHGSSQAQQGDKTHLLSSFAEQFNLTKSAQNLISLQQQRQQLQLGNLIAQQHRQQHQDLNDWLSAYNNLIQSNEFQHSNQIDSSLLAKISALPEPYQSALVAQLIQQQHQMHLIQSSVGMSVADKIHQRHQVDASTAVPGEQQASMNLHLGNQRSNSISRALSSPILIASNVLKGNACMDVEMQTNEFGVQGQDRQQIDHVDEEIGLFARTLQKKLSSNQNNQDELQRLDCSFTGAPADDCRTSADGMNQFSLDLSVSSASGSGGDRTTSSGISYKHMGHNPFGPMRSEESMGNLPANSASMLCSSNAHDKYNKHLNNCTNLIYTPLFEPTSSTGLIYELELCNHKCICNNENNHPENSYRVLAIWRRLYDSGLMRKCARIAARKASMSELQLCHSETYANYFGRNPYERIKLRQLDLSKLPIEGLTQLECGGQGADIDTAWNEEKTPSVARLAAGCVIEAAIQVAEGKLLNAFAIVRPPGHHAEYQQAMGFCFFNSIAIAARVMIERHQLNRVLIVDWDVHHGNGIQKMFYEDKRVMYISLHRHDKGNFFPGTGNFDEVGSGAGEGFNWNIAWSGETMGDAEYLAAFRSLVMPIAREFNPFMVLVACGFDGSLGHPFNFGGYKLSPACFAHMTRQLMGLANGRLVLALEGGYQLSSICDCTEACVRALLKDGVARVLIDNQTESAPVDQVLECELKRQPNQSAREVLHRLSKLATKYWPSVQMWSHAIDLSAFDVPNKRP